MGEVILSSEEMEMKMGSEIERMGEEMETESGIGLRKEGCLDGWKKWERFMPKMALRVLLVEADDCTRQIITALLRKCNYKVAAIPDGLKAWEILKRRPHEIDLILTEVDLPSISGFALLSLIMEDEICKNIPVIMMSLQDSVSTVYKCMLRGAADYLVKPLRRNELRNLWQHVWRRQSLTSGGSGLPTESVAQQKVEGTSENNAASNHSSGYMACTRRNKKFADAQSSCIKPDMEIESASMGNVQDFSQPIQSKSFLCGMKVQEREVNAINGQKMLMKDCETVGAMGACKDVNTKITLAKDADLESQRRDGDIASEGSDNNDALVNSSREAIDLIGAFNNYPSCSYRNSSSDNGTSKFDIFSPPLDLSLRSQPSDFENQATDGRHMIKQSNASAFTRYINRPLQHLLPILGSVCSQQNECGTNSENNVVTIVTGYSPDAQVAAPSTQKSTFSLATDQSKQYEVTHSCPQQKVFPVPVPVRGIRFSNICNGSYDTGLPPIFHTESGPSMMQTPSSASHQEPQVRPYQQSNFENNSEGIYDANDCTYQMNHKQERKLDCMEEQRQISLGDQSASSNLCNGTISHLTSIGYGSICGSNTNVDQVIVVRDAAESKNEEGIFAHNKNFHRSIQREVALTKFRLKRKDRCFEKKVRYESRKKLAEQRPRVKGQFVRQMYTGPQPEETENQHGNSSEGQATHIST